MKKLLFLTAALFMYMSIHASIVYVSNEMKFLAQYDSIYKAIDAVVAGDTIIVFLSDTSYGDITIDKHLVLIGCGHRPVMPYGDYNYKSRLGTITLDAGADKSTICGFRAQRLVNSGNCDSITIERNYFTKSTSSAASGYSLVLNDCQGWIIRHNVIYGLYWDGSYSNLIGISTSRNTGNSILIYNNIIYGQQLDWNSSNIIVHNNVFVICAYRINSSIGGCLYNVDNVTFENNIFFRGKEINNSSTCSGNNFNYNASYGLSDNSIVTSGNFGANNFENTDPLFEDDPAHNAAYIFDSDDVHLQSGSSLKNAGADGTDLGIYGGPQQPMPFSDSTWQITGMPNIPYVKNYNINSALIPADSSIIITIEAYGHE